MRILACLVLVAAGCGYMEPNVYEDSKKTVAVKKKEFAEIKPLVDAYCGGCHNGDSKPVIDEYNWGTARELVKNDIMPKNGTLPEDVKAKMLEVE